MKSGKRSGHIERAKTGGRFLAARAMLQKHLVHRRDLLNGRDFLFSGPAEEIHEALKSLVNIEHRNSPFLQLDYVQVEDYFLLRVTGQPEYQHFIHSYFAEDEDSSA